MNSEKSKTNRNVSRKFFPAVLIILDGWGMASKENKGNAIAYGNTPNFDALWEQYPHALLNASGSAVGLPKSQVGNSEAGHNTIGAGRVVEQEALRIMRTIRNGSFFRNPSLLRAIEHVKKHKTRLHFMGLLTDEQSAHAHPNHVKALFRLCETHGIKKGFLHLFTDGRDSGQKESMKFLHKLHTFMPPQFSIATIMGRYYGMERSKRWAITEKAYHALVLGIGKKARTAQEAILSAYDRGETDEFILPTIIGDRRKDGEKGRMNHGDAIIFFNLRSDRARQLTKPFVQQAFFKANEGAFQRQKVLHNIVYVCLTDFGPDLDHVLTAFPANAISNALPMMLRERRQFYIAESEKFAHMTYFFNGGFAHPIANEARQMVQSPDVQNYSECPEMSASETTKILISHIKKDSFDFLGINYANPDMVGHTGNFHAAVKACEITDNHLGQIVKAVFQKNGIVFLTADHGNAEAIVNPLTGAVDSEHNANPVPFIIISKSMKGKSMDGKGSLAQVAPTILAILGLVRPKEMVAPIKIF